MKHTECKECKLREGDCGHHFKMDGITDYDIPSQSACDQYDNCMFFQADLNDEYKIACNVLLDLERIVRLSDGWEDSAVEAVHNAVQTAIKRMHERTQGEWGKWIIAEIQCPNCFEYFEVDCYSTEELNKCPSCGADMRKGGEEE